MKTIAYTALHYGRDYLASAIRSIIEHVDEYYVLYSAIGSHGHAAPIPCPETRDELHAIAAAAAGDKLRWFEGYWPYEGLQRDSIHALVPDADVVLVLDADEIWRDVGTQIELAAAAGARRVRVNMVHFWRSMHRAVLHDPAFPERIIFPKRSNGEATIMHLPIAHMGYAQRSEIVSYKLLTHGHRGEFRRDCDWFQDVFMANRQTDCHPVGSEYWNPETVNPLDYMPAWMAEHPYFSLETVP